MSVFLGVEHAECSSFAGQCDVSEVGILPHL